MKLDRTRIASRTKRISLKAWPRIFAAAHRHTPTDAGHGSSRFSSPSRAFRVVYAANDFPTAFAEAVVRDRFEEKLRRYVLRSTFDGLVVAELSTKAPLSLVDLTDGGAYELGIDTDAKGARSHEQGQAFAEALHNTAGVDGILFSSRLTDRHCVAVFDRAFTKLGAESVVDLIRVKALADEIKRLSIIVRKPRR